MKLKIYLFLTLLVPILSFAQEQKAEKAKYNQKLADSLGADKYGMKPYMIVMLTTGSVTIEDKVKMGEIMKGHMTNIGKLANEGKIVAAGPFLEKNKENYRGMFIFNTQSKEEAEQW
ncbi:YciI family protein [Chryseobacterium sp. CBSDS_008]|uniref:YciI family protein n=1 Tax=Chryseobacterium sp. CBSDS_008 TaxID=3415265 RepID=UPI003CF07428